MRHIPRNLGFPLNSIDKRVALQTKKSKYQKYKGEGSQFDKSAVFNIYAHQLFYCRSNNSQGAGRRLSCVAVTSTGDRKVVPTRRRPLHKNLHSLHSKRPTIFFYSDQPLQVVRPTAASSKPRIVISITLPILGACDCCFLLMIGVSIPFRSFLCSERHKVCDEYPEIFVISKNRRIEKRNPCLKRQKSLTITHN